VGGYVEEAYPELKSVDMEKLSPLGSAEGVLDAVKNSKNIRILFLQGSHDKVTGAKKNGVGQLIKAIKDANGGTLPDTIQYQEYPTDPKDHDGHTTRYHERSEKLIQKLIGEFFGGVKVQK
jgi:hypothetical protein